MDYVKAADYYNKCRSKGIQGSQRNLNSIPPIQTWSGRTYSLHMGEAMMTIRSR